MRMMTWTRTGLAGILAMGILVLVAGADGNEEELTIDQVPAAVKATILREANGAPIAGIERETKNGRTIYEAEFRVNGREIEIQIAPDGTLLSRRPETESDDDDLRIDEVPEPARAALRQLAGDATITEVERDRQDRMVLYEAEWRVGETRHEAAVTPDGTLVEQEQSVALEAAPQAVRTRVTERFGNQAKVKLARKLIVVYEAECRVNGVEREILVLPTGRVLEDPDDDDGNKDDDDDDDADNGNDDD